MLDACIMEGRDNQTPNAWYRKDNTLRVDCIGHVGPIALSNRGIRDNRLHILRGLESRNGKYPSC